MYIGIKFKIKNALWLQDNVETLNYGIYSKTNKLCNFKDEATCIRSIKLHTLMTGVGNIRLNVSIIQFNKFNS